MWARRGCGCGCGGSLVLLIALVAAGYFLVYRPVAVFVDGLRAPPGQSAGVPAASGNIRAVPSKADIEKFVRIRRAERQALGSNFASVQTIFQQVQNGQTPSFWQVTGVLRDVGSSVGAVRAAQTAGLASEKLSRERYNVLRDDVNRALGLPDIDFGKIATELKNGKLPDLNTTVKLEANPKTAALIQPFKSELTATAALGLLGF
ncbi:hypothetical protein FNU79_12990 [Deinococcus detaillensis]|uniref:Uncharacterized protein n=1 Tax=Deinococcus detaillensis TaxID=2592048 RepID=A0A553US25_9DEIO|nr:hypothetical protein FNU79_12990 [Deinococcus detaillensis]